MRAAHLEPLAEYPGAHAPWLSRCLRCTKLVTPRYNGVRRGTGCRYCNDTTIKPDVAAARMRGVDLEPLEPYPGSLRPWKCRCLRCKRIVTPCYSTVKQGWGGCRWCRTSGFKAADEALIYLITHPGYGAAKIGVTAPSGVRLSRHQTQGWQVLVSETVDGQIALGIEQDILNWWRVELGLPKYLSPKEMPNGGHTETVETDCINLAATMSRIRSLIRGKPSRVRP
ncbi:hypothetical protein GTS_55550 [Gandjariella thermophila]|uniref:Uncharacterized protein n=1 Tax=Gandjariella thermophila TaxID=1931992 RepID=A0A4D4JET1_9PSEU|nr:hypothetical protein GTS_55550 [Gandjariella thermophila]